MTKRARWLDAGVLVVVIGVTAGVVATAWDPGPNRVQAALERAISPHDNPCASVTLTDLAPSAFQPAIARFARRAAERSVIECLVAGPTTEYFRFLNHRDLDAALRVDPDIGDLQLCILDHEAFTGADMNFAGFPGSRTFEHTCAALDGRVLL